MCAGFITGILYTKGKIPVILAGRDSRYVGIKFGDALYYADAEPFFIESA